MAEKEQPRNNLCLSLPVCVDFPTSFPNAAITMTSNHQMRGWSTEYGEGMEDELSVSIDEKVERQGLPNSRGEGGAFRPNKGHPFSDPLGLEVAVPLSSTAPIVVNRGNNNPSSFNDEAEVKTALGKLWDLAMVGGEVQQPQAVNAAFLPRKPGPMPRALFQRLIAAVEQASVLLPTNWYSKKGDHSFVVSSKTPDLNVRERSLPNLNSSSANLPPSSDPLTFEQFGEAWLDLSKKYCATSKKEDYFEFTGRMLLSAPKGYEKLGPTAAPLAADASAAALVGVGVGLGLGEGVGSGAGTITSPTIGVTSPLQTTNSNSNSNTNSNSNNGNNVLSMPSSASPIEVKIISRPGSRAGNSSPLGRPDTGASDMAVARPHSRDFAMFNFSMTPTKQLSPPAPPKLFRGSPPGSPSSPDFTPGLENPDVFKMSVEGSQAITLTGHEQDLVAGGFVESAAEVVNRRISNSTNLYADAEQRRSTVGKIMNLKAKEGKVSGVRKGVQTRRKGVRYEDKLRHRSPPATPQPRCGRPPISD